MLCPLVDAVLDVAVRINSWIQASLVRASGVRPLSAPGVGRSIQNPMGWSMAGDGEKSRVPKSLKIQGFCSSWCLSIAWFGFLLEFI